MDRGSKFIPCIHYNNFSIFNFILNNFDINFNTFNSRIMLNHKHFVKNNIREKTSSFNNITFNVCPNENLNSCLADKCKKLRNNFSTLRFPTSKDSLDFKFSFYKSLSDVNFQNKINLNKEEIYFMKKFNNEKNFKIIDCDKNVGTCFISNCLYDEFLDSHLNSRDVYLNLDYNVYCE